MTPAGPPPTKSTLASIDISFHVLSIVHNILSSVLIDLTLFTAGYVFNSAPQRLTTMANNKGKGFLEGATAQQ